MSHKVNANQVTLIFTVFNEFRTIEKFLDSLVSQSLIPTQIIAVDGGSTDGTIGIIDRYFFDLDGATLVVDDTCNLAHTMGPIARGRNLAISLSEREFIAATDAGCRLAESWFEKMLSGLESDVDVVAGNYCAARGNDFQRKTARLFEPDLTRARANPKLFFPSSRSILFRRKLWEAVGGYSEDSLTAEDTKFVRDVYKICEGVVLCEDAIVEWETPRDMKEMCRKVERYGFGDGVHRLDGPKYFFRVLVLVTLPISFWMLLLARKPILAVPIYYYQTKGFFRGMLGK